MQKVINLDGKASDRIYRACLWSGKLAGKPYWLRRYMQATIVTTKTTNHPCPRLGKHCPKDAEHTPGPGSVHSILSALTTVLYGWPSGERVRGWLGLNLTRVNKEMKSTRTEKGYKQKRSKSESIPLPVSLYNQPWWVGKNKEILFKRVMAVKKIWRSKLFT